MIGPLITTATLGRGLFLPYCIIICGLPGSNIYFRIVSQTTRFSEKLLNTEYVLRLFLQTLSVETFLIIRIIERDVTINVHRFLCQVTIILV